MRLTVLGTGYLGATHAACMAELGFEVLGMDDDAGKVASLSEGQAPFFEPGLDDLLRRNLDTGRLRFTTSYEEAAAFGDVHFICVGTPQQRNSNAADMRYVDSVVEGLAPHLHRPCLVVGKSTVPVGTAERMAETVAALAPAGAAATVAWNPEFLREGHAIEDTLRPDRLVVGVTDERSEQVLRTVYGPLLDAGVPMVVTDLATAQLVKVAANAFLATKISFINEMANICEALGADVKEVAIGMGYDNRIGPHFLEAGMGYGGSCFPKDVLALAHMAAEKGRHPQLLNAVMDINTDRRRTAVNDLREMIGGFNGKQIGILGLAFKPNTDDMRDAPAVDIANAVMAEGARVKAYDPVAMEVAALQLPTVEMCQNAYEVADGSDAILLITDWNEFKQLDLRQVRELMRTPVLFDGRNIYDPKNVRAIGFNYRAIGRGFGGNGVSIHRVEEPTSAL